MRVTIAFVVFLIFGIGCVPMPVLDKPYSDSGLPFFESEETLLIIFKNDPGLVFNPKVKWDISINGEKFATIYDETYAAIELGIGSHTIEASKSNIFSNLFAGTFIQNLFGSQKDTVGPSLELTIDKFGTVEYVRLSLRSKAILVGMEMIDNVAVGRYIISDATLQRLDKEEAAAPLQNTRSVLFTKE